MFSIFIFLPPKTVGGPYRKIFSKWTRILRNKK